jgi:hypothetical protein
MKRSCASQDKIEAKGAWRAAKGNIKKANG